MLLPSTVIVVSGTHWRCVTCRLHHKRGAVSLDQHLQQQHPFTPPRPSRCQPSSSAAERTLSDGEAYEDVRGGGHGNENTRQRSRRSADNISAAERTLSDGEANEDVRGGGHGNENTRQRSRRSADNTSAAERTLSDGEAYEDVGGGGGPGNENTRHNSRQSADSHSSVSSSVGRGRRSHQSRQPADSSAASSSVGRGRRSHQSRQSADSSAASSSLGRQWLKEDPDFEDSTDDNLPDADNDDDDSDFVPSAQKEKASASTAHKASARDGGRRTTTRKQAKKNIVKRVRLRLPARVKEEPGEGAVLTEDLDSEKAALADTASEYEPPTETEHTEPEEEEGDHHDDRSRSRSSPEKRSFVDAAAERKTTPKGKRGRKRASEPAPDKSQAVVAKKKRGRPPKAKPPPEEGGEDLPAKRAYRKRVPDRSELLLKLRNVGRKPNTRTKVKAEDRAALRDTFAKLISKGNNPVLPPLSTAAQQGHKVRAMEGGADSAPTTTAAEGDADGGGEGGEGQVERAITEVGVPPLATAPASSSAATLTPENNAATLTPENNAATLTPENNATTLTPENNAATLTPENNAATLTRENNAATLTPENNAATLRPENNAATLTPENNAATLTPENNAASLRPEKHAEVGKVRCGTCCSLFSSQASLQAHADRTRGQDVFQCRTCRTQFHGLADLNMHVFCDHRYEQQPVCFLCTRDFVSMDTLEKHLLGGHREEKEEEEEDPSPPPPPNPPRLCDTRFHDCRLCGMELNVDLQLIKNHYYRRHKAYVCPDCFTRDGAELLFYTDTHLYGEHKQMHAQSPAACAICARLFISARQMKTHMWTHAADTTEDGTGGPCGKCGQRLPNAGAALMHEKEHKNEAIRKNYALEASIGFPCMKCVHIFSSKSNLKKHSCKADPQRRFHFHCEYCAHGCNTKEQLRDHIALHHLKIRRYACSHCPQRFVCAPTLRRHVRRLHTREKPYACHLCAQRFFERNLMLRHVSQHQGVAGFTCEVCGKGFHTQFDLKKHAENHTNSRAFVCPHCSLDYKRSYHLKRHLEKGCKKGSALNTGPKSHDGGGGGDLEKGCKKGSALVAGPASRDGGGGGGDSGGGLLPSAAASAAVGVLPQVIVREEGEEGDADDMVYVDLAVAAGGGVAVGSYGNDDHDDDDDDDDDGDNGDSDNYDDSSGPDFGDDDLI